MPGLINLRGLPSAATTAAGTNPGERTQSSQPFATFKPEKGFEERVNPHLTLSRIRLLQPPVAQPFKLSHFQASAGLEEVVDPIEEKARLRFHADGRFRERMIPAYSSGGRDHDLSSVCLVAMVHEFLESNASSGICGRPRCTCLRGNCSDEACATTDRRERKSITSTNLKVLRGLVNSINEVERVLLADVVDAVNSITEIENSVCKDQREIFVNGCCRRALMKKLIMRGYNAAVCKSRWCHSVGFPAGEYEYIDVIVQGTNGKSERLIVDVEFRSQFEIARPTNEYVEILHLLSPIYVGKPDRLQEILVVMSEAAKQSLKTTGLHLPPWRKPDYLRAKWFSPFKRTTDDFDHSRGENGTSRRLHPDIGMRGVRHTNELKMLFDDVAYAENNGRKEKCVRNSSEYDFPEGLGSKLRSGRKWDETKAMSTEWQLPSVGQKRSSEKPAKVVGLASVLLQTGLNTDAETRHENAAMKERLAIVV